MLDLLQAHHGSDPSTGTTTLFAFVLGALILALALEEKLHAKKSVIAGVFALVSLFLGAAFHLLPFEAVVVGGHEISMPVFIPAIDWNVISIILGASLFVDITSKSGLFTWIAIRLTKASRGDPARLLWFYGVMTVVFSAVLNNVTAMLIVGSLTVVSLGRLERNDKLFGFLMIEGLLTNVGGLLTLISSVPNIIVGKAAGIGFMSFLISAAPFVLVGTVATIALGAKLFGIAKLKTEEERESALTRVSAFDEWDGVESRSFFWFGSVMTVLFILVIASASQLPLIRDLGMSFVAMGFAIVMLVRFKAVADRFYQALDWDLLGFFAALFVVIYVMEHAAVLTLIGEGIAAIIELGGVPAVLVASAGFSSVTDNIPLAAMLAKILAARGTPGDDPLWWAVVFGANLGGNITPIGSASTLVAVTIMHKHKVPLSFGAFVKTALPYAAIQIAIAAAYLMLVF